MFVQSGGLILNTEYIVSATYYPALKETSYWSEEEQGYLTSRAKAAELVVTMLSVEGYYEGAAGGYLPVSVEHTLKGKAAQDLLTVLGPEQLREE